MKVPLNMREHVSTHRRTGAPVPVDHDDMTGRWFLEKGTMPSGREKF
ncbi:MAG: hypothetical protein H6R26_1220, partial [Proteobacteria bacterium]|nr:hypothetical protein [Pseudomonadota bacterium]